MVNYFFPGSTVVFVNTDTMAKKKTTEERILANQKKVNRELEMQDQTGWTANEKVHKDKKKTIHRKRKHKNQD